MKKFSLVLLGVGFASSLAMGAPRHSTPDKESEKVRYFVECSATIGSITYTFYTESYTSMEDAYTQCQDQIYDLTH